MLVHLKFIVPHWAWSSPAPHPKSLDSQALCLTLYYAWEPFRFVTVSLSINVSRDLCLRYNCTSSCLSGCNLARTFLTAKQVRNIRSYRDSSHLNLNPTTRCTFQIPQKLFSTIIRSVAMHSFAWFSEDVNEPADGFFFGKIDLTISVVPWCLLSAMSYQTS